MEGLFLILVLCAAVNGVDFRMDAESYRWISMQTVAPLYPKCAISQSHTMQSQRSISNELQHNAKIDLNLNVEKNSYDILVIHMFLCDKAMAIPQTKFGFCLAFNQSVWPSSGLFLALFGFLLTFFSGCGLFYCWSLLCNNNMATNLLIFK